MSCRSFSPRCVAGQAPDPRISSSRAVPWSARESSTRRYGFTGRPSASSAVVRCAARVGHLPGSAGTVRGSADAPDRGHQPGAGGPARNQALNAMAISYAFESRAADALKYLAPVFDQQLADQDLGGAAATANAIGRIYLETGDTANARRWYDTRHEQARRSPACRSRSRISGSSAGCTPRRASPRARTRRTRPANKSRRSSR